MDADILISLVVILLPLSFISERLSNLIKLFLPAGGWLGIGNVKYRETNPVLEKRRERRIFVISLISGEVVAFALRADLFTILNSGKFGWTTDYPDAGWSWILGCFFTGFFLSWGSKFWHDLLGILLEMKKIRRVDAEQRAVEVKRKAIETRKLAEEFSDSEDEPVGPVTKNSVSERKLPKEDSITLKRIEKLHPRLRSEALGIYREILQRGIAVRFTDTLRTFEQQDALYAQGRTKPGRIVTNARAGQSFHNYGLAVDFCLLLDDGAKASWDRKADFNRNRQADWDEVVAVFAHFGWEWGGAWKRFKDYPHFQKTFGYSTARLLKLHDDGKLDNEGYVVLS